MRVGGTHQRTRSQQANSRISVTVGGETGRRVPLSTEFVLSYGSHCRRYCRLWLAVTVAENVAPLSAPCLVQCLPSGVASAATDGPPESKDHEVDTQQKLKFNEDNIAEFRAGGGRIASFGDAPLLLLTTAGAKSGRRRTSPMMYLADEHDSDRVYVFASAAGDDQHPAWFHNVVAQAPVRRIVEADC